MERFWIVTHVLGWGLGLLQLAVLIALLWAVGRIHLKDTRAFHALITDEGPDIHEPLPPFAGRDATGRSVRSLDYAGRSFVLLLVSPECAPCEQLLAAVNPAVQAIPGFPEPVVVMEGDSSNAELVARRDRLNCPVIVDPDGAIREGLGVQRTPYAFLVDEAGVVRMKGIVNSGGQLEGLVRRRGRHIGNLEWQTVDTGLSTA